MPIPQVIITACPGCGQALELNTFGWSVSFAERNKDENGEGGGHGIVLELAAFGGHVCWLEA